MKMFNLFNPLQFIRYLTFNFTGGGGSSAPTSQKIEQTTIPEYARPYAETMLGKTAALTDINQNPYQPYTGQQVAGLSPLQQQAMGSIGGQQVSSQLGTATDLATQSGFGGLGAQQNAMGLQGTALGYGQAGSMYGGAASQFGAAGAQQAQNAAMQAQRQASMYGSQGAQYGGQGMQYGAQGAGIGAQGVEAAQQGFGAGAQYAQQATSPAAQQAYMSPYMQNVVDVQSQEARRQADIARQGQKSQATGQGAFGGSRSAIVQSEADRNLATQLGQIQATGSQQAFDKAQQAQQFGANLGLQGLQAGYQGLQTGMAGTAQGIQGAQAGMQGAGLGLQGVGQQIAGGQLGLSGAQTGIQGQQAGMQGAGVGLSGVQAATGAGQYGLQGLGAAGSAASTLGALGQTQYGQEMGISQAQMQAGALQQSQEQRGLDVAYQQYQDQLNYPYKQLAFQSDMFRGLPLTQGASTMYQNTGATAPQLLGAGLTAYGISQRAKNGGTVKSYAEGGTTTVDPSVPSSIGPQALSSRLAKLSDEQLMAYARTVKDAVALAEVKGEIQRREEARQPQGQMPTGTVAQGVAPEEQGQIQPQVMAGGGIVALSNGGKSEWGEGVAKAIKERDERVERSRALGPLTDITGPIGFLTAPGVDRRVAETTLGELRNAPMEDVRAYRDTGAIPRSVDELGDPSAVANMADFQASEAERRQANTQARAQGSTADRTDPLGDSSAVPLPPPPTEFPEEGVSPVTGTAPSVSPNAPPGTAPVGIAAPGVTGQAPAGQAPAGQAPAAPTGSTGIVPSSKAPTAMATGAVPIANPGDPMGWGAYKANVDDMAKLDPEQKAVLDDMRKRTERKMGRAEKQESNVAYDALIAGGLAMMGGLNLSDGVRRLAEGGGKKYFESSADARKAIEAADDAQGAFDQYQLSLKQGNKKVAADMYGKYFNTMADFQGKIQAANISAAASGAATAEAAKGRVQSQANILADRQLARDQQQQQFDMQIQQQAQQFKLNLERQQDTARLNQFEQLDRTYGTTMNNRDKAEAAIIAEFKPKFDRFAFIDPAKMSETDKRQLNLVNTQLKEAKLTKLSKWDEQLNEIQNRKATMMGIRPIGGGSGTSGAGGNIPTYDPSTGNYK